MIKRQETFNRSLARLRRRGGFTLIELLVVMVIIGLLAALVGPKLLGKKEQAEVGAARAQMEMFSTALDTFRLDVGRYPTTDEGLDALVRKPATADRWDGPYLRKDAVPLDPWRKPYIYRSPGEHGAFDIFTYGSDGAPGGEGNNRDIGNWETGREG
jgi:general secretion pathway protein G